MRISTKLIINIGLFAVFGMAVVAGILVMTTKVEKAISNNNLIEQILDGINDLNIIAYSYAMSREERPRMQWELKHASLEGLIHRVTTEEKTALARMAENHKLARMLFDQLTLKFQNSPSLGSNYEEETDRMVSQFIARTQMMRTDALFLKNRSNASLLSMLQKGFWIFIGLVVGLLGIVVLTSIFLSRKITGSLHTLQKGTEIIRSGNFEHRTAIASNDEIGRLSGSFDYMADSLKQTMVSRDALQKEVEERKRMEEALRKERDFTSAVLDTAGALVVVLDKAGQIIDFNRACEVITGYSAKEVMGRVFWEFLVPQEEIQGVMETWQALQAGNFPNRHENQWVAKNGSRSILAWTNTAIVSRQGEIAYIIGTGIDITERKQAEMALQQKTLELAKLNQTLEEKIQERTEELKRSQERLQQLASQLLLAQERERKRVAVELHDGLLSELAGMKFLFEAKLMLLKRGKLVDPNEFNRVTEIMQKVIKDTRGIMNNLRPSTLDEIGLLATIGWLIMEYQRAYSHLEVCKKVEVSEKDIPETLKIIIFRVLQEALNNFAKHGRGKRVDLSLLKSGDTLDLTVQDNGQGFDVERVQKGLGLESMRERVEISGGKFQIESAIGQGTNIRATWKLS